MSNTCWRKFTKHCHVSNFQAYVDVPQNPDRKSTDRIRFKCKSQCISDCFKEGITKTPKYYDGSEIEQEWQRDSNITLTCLDESNSNNTSLHTTPDSGNNIILQ